MPRRTHQPRGKNRRSPEHGARRRAGIVDDTPVREDSETPDKTAEPVTRAGAIAAAAVAGPSLYDAPEPLMQDEEDNADRRARRIAKIVERERSRDPRRWMSFAEITQTFFNEFGSEGRQEAYVRLLIALLDGQFGQPLFLSEQPHQDWGSTRAAVLKSAKSFLEWSGYTNAHGLEKLRERIADHASGFEAVKDGYLKCCWIRRAKAEEWVKQERPKGEWVRPDPAKVSETPEGQASVQNSETTKQSAIRAAIAALWPGGADEMKKETGKQRDTKIMDWISANRGMTVSERLIRDCLPGKK